MARHREFNIDDVTDKALKVFSERGYSHTSISDLVKATGVKAGSLHVAYGNKEDVFIECLKRYEKKMRDLIPVKESGLKAIEALLKSILKISLPGPDFMGCPGMHSSNAFSEMSGCAEVFFQKMKEDFSHFLTAKVKEAQEKNEIRTDMKAQDITCLLIATVYGVRMMGYEEESPKTLKAIINTAIAALKK